MPPEDIIFLNKHEAFAIPTPPVRDSLIRSFIDCLYGIMPIIDIHEFLDIVEQGDGRNGRISLLVFQAIMFAGSAFADMVALRPAGFQTRRSARCAVFQKVRVRVVIETINADASDT